MSLPSEDEETKINNRLMYKMPKMTDAQKSQLNKHMEAYSGADKKAHRMRMMVRMMKGMSVTEAHKDINKK
jgi:hypothetical protein